MNVNEVLRFGVGIIKMFFPALVPLSTAPSAEADYRRGWNF